MPLERPQIDKPEGDIPFDLGIEDLVVGDGEEAVKGSKVVGALRRCLVLDGRGIRRVLEPRRAVHVPARQGARHPAAGTPASQG